MAPIPPDYSNEPCVQQLIFSTAVFSGGGALCSWTDGIQLQFDSIASELPATSIPCSSSCNSFCGSSLCSFQDSYGHCHCNATVLTPTYLLIYSFSHLINNFWCSHVYLIVLLRSKTMSLMTKMVPKRVQYSNTLKFQIHGIHRTILTCSVYPIMDLHIS